MVRPGAGESKVVSVSFLRKVQKRFVRVVKSSSLVCKEGPKGGTLPSSILNTEIASLTQAIKTAAPTLSEDNAHEIALGTISEWIMRCPLDFPVNAH